MMQALIPLATSFFGSGSGASDAGPNVSGGPFHASNTFTAGSASTGGGKMTWIHYSVLGVAAYLLYRAVK